MNEYKFKHHAITLKDSKHCNGCPWFVKEMQYSYFACDLLSERLIDNTRHENCPLELRSEG